MATFLNRALSLLAYVAYVGAAYAHAGGATALKLAMGLLLPLACVWFSESLGDYTGMIRLHPVTSTTPAFLVCAGGWLILIGVPLLVYFLPGAI